MHHDGQSVDGFTCAHDVSFRSYLSELVVSPESQRRGIGSRLLSEIERRMAARGCSLMVADVWRDAQTLLTEAGFGAIRVSPRTVYVDSSKPELVEGFTKRTLTANDREHSEILRRIGLMSEADFDEGVADLYRTAEADGVFCYTFFKASAVRPANPARAPVHTLRP